MIGREIERGTFAIVGLLRHVIDNAAGGGYAALKPCNAFHNFNALLVLERNVLFAGDGHAVDLKPGGEIDGKTADLEVAVVAHRRIVLADRSVILHDV